MDLVASIYDDCIPILIVEKGLKQVYTARAFVLTEAYHDFKRQYLKNLSIDFFKTGLIESLNQALFCQNKRKSGFCVHFKFHANLLNDLIFFKFVVLRNHNTVVD